VALVRWDVTHFSINWEGEEIPGKATEGLVRMLRDHFR